MPDFTVIEGGGKGPEFAFAKEAFASLIRECVKVLGTQDGHSYRITSAFFDAIASVSGTELNVHDVIAAAALGMREEMDRNNDKRWSKDFLIRSALMLAVEQTTNHGLSRARQSKRSADLDAAIRYLIMEKEERTRERGWSYLNKILDELEPWPPRPAPKPGAAPKRKPRKI